MIPEAPLDGQRGPTLWPESNGPRWLIALELLVGLGIAVWIFFLR